MRAGRKTPRQRATEAALSRLDYGPDAGAGLEHADEGRGRWVITIDPRADMPALLATLGTMEGGARLIRHAQRPTWYRELSKWVRKRMGDNLDIPEGIKCSWKID